MSSLAPVTAKEALDVWEGGGFLTVPSLGGFGPGYEQAIWVGVFRLIKECWNMDVTDWVDKHEWRKIPGSYLTIPDKHLMKVSADLGLSGAQAGQIINFTYEVLKNGWTNTIKTVAKEKQIIIMDSFISYRPIETAFFEKYKNVFTEDDKQEILSKIDRYKLAESV